MKIKKEIWFMFGIIACSSIISIMLYRSCQPDRTVRDIKGDLKTVTAPILDEISKLKAKVLFENEELKRELTVIQGEQSRIVAGIEKWKPDDEKLKKKPAPAPEVFQELDRCNEKFEELRINYTLCLGLHAKKDITIESFLSLAPRWERAIKSFQEQQERLNKIIDSTVKIADANENALKQMNKKKRPGLFRDLILVGASVGLTLLIH